MPQPHAIQVNMLEKSYGEHKALKGISFDVHENEIFGFIGPDGAGKTTLFRILATLLLPGAGQVEVLGRHVVQDFRYLRNHIGYMPGRFSLYQDLSVEENLRFFAGIFHTTPEANYDLIKDIYGQIEPFKHRRAGKLSGGMKQKLALSCALIHKPRLLILDEPTTGVDAVSRAEFWEMLARLREKNITIIASTPYMDEASRCDRVALIQDGALLRIDTPEGIRNRFGKKLFRAEGLDKFHLLNDLRSFPGMDKVYAFGKEFHLTFQKEEDIPALHRFLESKGHHNVLIESIQPGVEDCFMQLMADHNTQNA